MTKNLSTLSADEDTKVTAEIDISGDGNWVVHEAFDVKAGESLNHVFPDTFSAYWIRFRSSTPCKVSAQLLYE